MQAKVEQSSNEQILLQRLSLVQLSLLRPSSLQLSLLRPSSVQPSLLPPSSLQPSSLEVQLLATSFGRLPFATVFVADFVALDEIAIPPTTSYKL